MSVKKSLQNFDWHKLMFVLPNLFTVSSIFCGFYAMVLSTQQKWIPAAIAIFFSNFFDSFDGRVARMTKTQSEFGTQLDSLADAMSFGMSPAMLVYLWSLKDLGLMGIIVSFLFATCGALRLARFNVLAIRHVPGSSDFFVGLPIPFGAGTIIALILAHESTAGGLVHSPSIVAVIVVALALFMVSGIRYRTFKRTKFRGRALGILIAVLLAGIVLCIFIHPAKVLLLYFLAYLVMGLVEGVIGLFRNSPEEAAQDSSEVSDPEATADDEEDDGEDEAENEACCDGNDPKAEAKA